MDYKCSHVFNLDPRNKNVSYFWQTTSKPLVYNAVWTAIRFAHLVCKPMVQKGYCNLPITYAPPSHWPIDMQIFCRLRSEEFGHRRIAAAIPLKACSSSTYACFSFTVIFNIHAVSPCAYFYRQIFGQFTLLFMKFPGYRFQLMGAEPDYYHKKLVKKVWKRYQALKLMVACTLMPQSLLFLNDNFL